MMMALQSRGDDGDDNGDDIEDREMVIDDDGGGMMVVPEHQVDWATEMTGGSKFEVSKFDGHGYFRLWQTRVKDLLAQQGIQKGMRAENPKGMEDDDWQDLQERAAGTIRLCLADEVMYHGNQDLGRRQGRDNSGNRNFRSKSRDKSQGRKTVTCYKCKKKGHFKRDYPN
ncbi:Unknown protein [Striga hermonthica]|uniref:CCHC-type domain-containing protein n=1 Tax=Striga hermonthica TaxID=68872 RepID=A0A9N7RQ52_STRHE|nr:Unknown protein [Striga hermonthica]